MTIVNGSNFVSNLGFGNSDKKDKITSQVLKKGSSPNNLNTHG
jgi:hypothetical protein